MKLRGIVLGGVVLSSILARCAAAEPAGPSRDKLRVGMLLTLSGSFASAGEDCRKGIEAGLAVAGPHTPIDVIFADSKNDPTTAISEFQRLVQTESAAAVYTHRSSLGMALNPISLKMQVPLLGAVGHKDFAAGNTFAFQIWPRSDDEGRFVADQFIKKGHLRAALIYTEDEWTTAVSQGFREEFLKRGGTLLFDQAVLPAEADVRTILLQVKEKRPDAIYMNVLLPQIALLVRQARVQGVGGRFYFNFYVSKNEVMDAVGAAALEGVSYVEPDSNLPALIAKLGAGDVSPQGLTLASYLAAMLLAQTAAENKGIRTAADLEAALLKQHEIRTPDYVYPIEQRCVKFPLVLKTMRNGAWRAEGEVK